MENKSYKIGGEGGKRGESKNGYSKNLENILIKASNLQDSIAGI